jgi:hypothetical protein
MLITQIKGSMLVGYKFWGFHGSSIWDYDLVWFWHHAILCVDADILEEYAASVFMVEMCKFRNGLGCYEKDHHETQGDGE